MLHEFSIKRYDYPAINGQTSIATRVFLREDHYKFEKAGENLLHVEKNGKAKNILIILSHEYTYKIMKSHVLASGGVDRLIDVMSDPFWQTIAEIIIDKAINWMKEALNA